MRPSPVKEDVVVDAEAAVDTVVDLEEAVEETQDTVATAGAEMAAMEVDAEAAAAMAEAVEVDAEDTETAGTGLEETEDTEVDPTEAARVDTDRVVAMEADRATAVVREEGMEVTEKIRLCMRKENNTVLKKTYFPTITILTFDVSTTTCLLAPLIS